MLFSLQLVMDYRRLQHFMAAVRHGNLTTAAYELGISQPALSKGIKALERSLGVALLERGRFGVAPTPYGEALLARGQIVEAELRNAVGEIEALKDATRGHVLVGCGPTEANRLLPLALQLLHASHPEIRVTVLYGLNESLMPWVRHGEVDFAISSIPQEPADTALIHDKLFLDKGVIVGRVDHPLSKKRHINTGDFADQQWVLPRSRELERQAFDVLMKEHHLTIDKALIETTSTVLMKAMVMQSNMLTFIPKELIYWEEQAGQLMAMAESRFQWARQVGITRRRQGTLTPASRLLTEALRQTATRHF
ncbi:MAG: LysR family transcriptional regulator [Gammaproteobacteria bacterium]|jgi:DNA-binding transcriptional LysR family regulator